MPSYDDIKAYWDARAGLGFEAGGPDVILKELEMRTIDLFVKDGMRILDVGCGNGITAIYLAKKHKNLQITGVDFSEAMIQQAIQGAASEGVAGVTSFLAADIRDMPRFDEAFDVVYTERCLVNLPTWPAQRKAIVRLMGLAKRDGIYLMCEAFQDGLDAINNARSAVGLGLIKKPFHNRYLRNRELKELGGKLWMYALVEFTGTYYFLSRVINAKLAEREGRVTQYNDPINKLALNLPCYSDIGQCKIWIWKKEQARRDRDKRLSARRPIPVLPSVPSGMFRKRQGAN